MRESRLRRLHRRLAITMAFFILLQAITGLLMGLGLLPNLYSLFGALHYGGGTGGSAYRVFLGIGTICTVASGLMVFLKIRTRSKRL